MITPNLDADKNMKAQNPAWALKDALPIALKYLHLFGPLCLYATIAGSIRRNVPQVNDLEIVCVPQRVELFETKAPKNTGDLFEPASEPEEVSLGFFPKLEFIEMVNAWEKVKGEPTGRWTQRILPEGLKFDLFMTTEADFFRQVAIRTGSRDFSFKVIATGWKNLGWCGTDDGLRRREQCEKTSSGWICRATDPVLPPEWKSEEEFFAFLQIPYVKPERRF